MDVSLSGVLAKIETLAKAKLAKVIPRDSFLSCRWFTFFACCTQNKRTGEDLCYSLQETVFAMLVEITGMHCSGS